MRVIFNDLELCSSILPDDFAPSHTHSLCLSLLSLSASLSLSLSVCSRCLLPFVLFCILTGENENLLCTVFSASNYGGGGNTAAYMMFSTSDKPLTVTSNTQGVEPTAVQGTGLFYSVFYFDIEVCVYV